jgi:alpha-D-ribose 1-methylphosphonate 5-triphosphate synthase subunit PhnG
MSLLARADLNQLEEAWQATERRPSYRRLRGPEIGLVMLRGRMGGRGADFNVGEATVSRCTVEIDQGTIGHAYVLGRHARHAELAAVFDALLQDSARRPGLWERLLKPIERRLTAQQAEQARRREATRVEFFTMVRGDD